MSSVATISKSILTDRNTVYTEQDVIELVISPEEVPMLNTSQGTYLKFLLEMDSVTSNCLAQPDPMSGGSAIIQTISIYSNNGQLLEQLEDVNTWTAMYYHYSKTQGLENMRTLMEGVSPMIGTGLKSQYFTFDPVEGTTFLPVECVIPLYMSGLLGQGQKLLPVVALGGLRIRIQLAKKEKALRAFTAIGYSPGGGPFLGVPQVRGLPVAGAPVMSAGTVGATFVTATTIAALAAIPFIDINTAGTSAAPAASYLVQALADFANVPWLPGQTLYVTEDGGNTVLLGTIATISSVGGLCRYTFTVPGAAIAQITAGNRVWSDANTLTSNFKMSNVELICSVVQADGKTISGLMNQVANGGGIRLDYPSYNLYRQNLQANIPRSELLIPCTEQRAMSIVSEPMRSVDQIWEDTLMPVGDQCGSYIWNIGNRLTPNRRVSVERVAATNANQELKWDSIHLHETEKAVGRCDIVPRNLCENARLFCMGRELAKSGHSFDANTNEIRLNIEYRSAAGDNVINKLVDTWLYHIRTVTITPNSIAVDF
tara:strand:+ start:4305 stop:5930 length:1626 start_codon:yes stop_codon:yes gene_type:complete